MKLGLIIFVLISLFLLNFGASAFSADKPKNTYTRIDPSSGQIQLVVDNVVVQSSPLDINKVKFSNNFDLIDIPQNADKDLKKTASILNMNEAWIHGERFITVDDHKYRVNLKQIFQAMKYLSYQTIKKASEKNSKIKLDKYSAALSKKEESSVDTFENQIQTAVQNLSAEEISDVKTAPQYKKLPKGFTNDYIRMEESVKSIAATGSAIAITMLDGNPYILNGDPNNWSYKQHVPAGGATLSLKSANGNLLCSGMAQTQQPPTNDDTVTLKLDFNFTPVAFWSSNTNSSEYITMVDTAGHNSVCSNTADRIFQSDFVTGER